MSFLRVKQKSVSRYAQNGSITHREIRRSDETNGNASEEAHADSRTAGKRAGNKGVSQANFCNVLNMCKSSASESDLDGDTLQTLTS